MKTVELTNTNVQEVLAMPNVIVDFWADWCGPCKMMSKNIEEAAPQISDNIVLAKCNVEENDDLVNKYGIQNLPTLLHIKNGNVEERHVGLMSKSEFTSFVIR